MKKVFLDKLFLRNIFLAVVVCAIICSGGIFSERSSASTEIASKDNIVVLSRGSESLLRQSVARLRGLEQKQITRLGPGLFLLQTKSPSRANRYFLADLVTRVRSLPGVVAAQRDFVVPFDRISRDPMSYRMWSFENKSRRAYQVGPYDRRDDTLIAKWYPSIKDSDIDLPAAWRLERGSKDTVIAVLDTGIDYLHPDLAGQLWKNKGEIPDNNIDDDGNGYIDDYHGWNPYSKNDDVMDLEGHGTHIAGTIGARTNNRKGVPGINQEVSIMPISLAQSFAMYNPKRPQTILSQIAAGMIYAADNGARVVNGSFGAPFPMPVLSAIIRQNPEVLFVFSAGNEAWNMHKKKTRKWPCNIKLANTICVASSDARDTISSFSNYGKKKVDIAAPGDSILSTVLYSDGCPGAPGRACQTTLNFGVNSQDDFNKHWAHGGAGDKWGFRAIRLAGQEYQTVTDSVKGRYLSQSSSFALSPEKTLPRPSPQCFYEALVGGVLESGEDVMRIQFSLDGGETFTKLLSFSGEISEMTEIGQIFAPLPRYFARNLKGDSFNRIQLRYRLDSDGDVEYDGSYIAESKVICQGDLPNLGVKSGTSMAVPHVVGVAGLLFSKKPEASPTEVKRALLRGSDKLRRPLNRVAGDRRLNAYRALRFLSR